MKVDPRHITHITTTLRCASDVQQTPATEPNRCWCLWCAQNHVATLLVTRLPSKGQARAQSFCHHAYDMNIMAKLLQLTRVQAHLPLKKRIGNATRKVGHVAPFQTSFGTGAGG